MLVVGFTVAQKHTEILTKGSKVFNVVYILRMYRVWGEERWGNLRERDHLKDRGVDGRIILRWIYRKGIWEYGLDRAGSGYGQVAGTCECYNEPSGSIKYGEFLNRLRGGYLLKKGCAPWSN